MAVTTKETISREEFDKRLDDNNERLRLELAETQKRVQRLEELLARKEAYSQRLTQILTEMEREENEIAALEEGLRLRKSAERGRPREPQAAQ